MSRSGIYDLEFGFIPDDDCPDEKPTKTNADKIRKMSDEELAQHLYWWDNSPLHASSERWLDWLKQEVE